MSHTNDCSTAPETFFFFLHITQLWPFRWILALGMSYVQEELLIILMWNRPVVIKEWWQLPWLSHVVPQHHLIQHLGPISYIPGSNHCFLLVVEPGSFLMLFTRVYYFSTTWVERRPYGTVKGRPPVKHPTSHCLTALIALKMLDVDMDVAIVL